MTSTDLNESKTDAPLPTVSPTKSVSVTSSGLNVEDYSSASTHTVTDSNKSTQNQDINIDVSGVTASGSTTKKQIGETRFVPLDNSITKSCFTLTIGGNSNGDKCNFPFLYEGAMKFDCIRIDSLIPWCATTSNYDRDRKWGICAGLSRWD